MTEITLKEFLAGGKQTTVAKHLGVTQSAISQMLVAGRDIRVVLDDCKQIVKVYEVKLLKETGTSKAA